MQAFRSGFREGVKLCLENDTPVIWEQMDKYNFDRLWMWMHVGTDIDNGIYAIYGARLGAYLTLYENFDYIQIRDFDYLTNLFNNININEIDVLGTKLSHPLISNVLSVEDSKRIRENYINPLRSNYPIYNSTYYFNLDGTFNNYPKYEKTHFTEWCESYRLAAKTIDENILNKMCTTGMNEPFGITKMLGAREGRLFNDHPYKLYDYVYLREQYEK
jgi:hypothetical protein